MSQHNNTLIIRGNRLFAGGESYACAIGKAGFSADKEEGDNCTPIGVFPLRELWFRADKMPMPNTMLPTRFIQPTDGWCDDAQSPDYNRRVTLPHPARHEKLWRDDELYDLVVVIGYNDDPVVSGKGSAIFMHIAKPGYEGTEGCVALKKEDLLAVLAHCGPDTVMEIESE